MRGERPTSAETITGDPSEGDISGIGNNRHSKPDSPTLDRIVKAFESIAMDIPELEKEYGKPIDQWTMDDVTEAREVFKVCKASRAEMLAKIAADKAAQPDDQTVI